MNSTVLVLHERNKARNEAALDLQARGFSVTTVETAEQAIELLKRSESFALIIAPVHLEEGDVFDFLRWVRGDNRHRHDPFVLICFAPSKFTKSIASGIEAASRVLGADEVVFAESFERESFWSIIEPLLSRRQQSLTEREIGINLREQQLNQREESVQQQQLELEQRDKFMRRRENRADASESV